MTPPAPLATTVLGTLHAFELPTFLPPGPAQAGSVTVLIDTADPVTLIDTGADTPGTREALRQALASLGLVWRDIRRIIVTHHHPDHLGLSGWVQAQSGAAVLLLESEALYLEQTWRDQDYWLLRSLMFMQHHGLPVEDLPAQHAYSLASAACVSVPLEPARLHQGEGLMLAGARWEVRWLPGHADGMIGLWQPDASVLIASDALLPRSAPTLGASVGGRPDPLTDYFDSLDQITAMNPRLTVVGHHGPLMLGAVDCATALRAHHYGRLNFVRDHFERPLTAWQMAQRIFGQAPTPAAARSALAEALAHLDHLRLRGELRRDFDGTVWIYEQTGR